MPRVIKRVVVHAHPKDEAASDRFHYTVDKGGIVHFRRPESARGMTPCALDVAIVPGADTVCLRALIEGVEKIEERKMDVVAGPTAPDFDVAAWWEKR
jgi:hypothetical protein